MNDISNRTARRIKKMRVTIAILTAVTIFLCIFGAVCCAIVLRREKNYRNAIASQKATIKEKQRIISEEMIPITKFKDYADRYGVNIHFVQQFFDDVIVYKNDQGIAYSPIDKNLAMNRIDTSLIEDAEGRKTYPANEIYDVKTAVDVSQYQGYVNWNSVAADGIDCAMIRLGYRGYGSGTIVTDSYFETNFSGATSAGLQKGVYFFSQAITVAEAEEEADFIISKLAGRKLDLPVVFDMEIIEGDEARANSLPAKEKTDIAIAFCERIKQAGYTPMIYGNIEWMCDHLEYSRLEGYAKWFAQYTSRPFFPYDYLIWQYTDSGKVNGISTGADLNLIFIPKN